MYVDFLTEEDIELVAGWMEARFPKGLTCSRSQFPNPAAGLIVRQVDGTGIAAVPVFFSGEAAFGGWCVGNPSRTRREVYNAVVLLFSCLPNYVCGAGAKKLMLMYGHRGINRILERIGYQAGDREVEHYFWSAE